MSETARAMLELVERGSSTPTASVRAALVALVALVAQGWGELTFAERALFRDWTLNAIAPDIFALLCVARDEWSRASIASPLRRWDELSALEKQIFVDWSLHAHGEDLFLLLRHAHRQWTRGRSSTSQTLAAITDTAAPASVPPPKPET